MLVLFIIITFYIILYIFLEDILEDLLILDINIFVCIKRYHYQ